MGAVSKLNELPMQCGIPTCSQAAGQIATKAKAYGRGQNQIKAGYDGEGRGRFSPRWRRRRHREAEGCPERDQNKGEG